MSFILYLLHTCACVAVYQGARGADLPVWTAYGWAEGAGGTDATGAAYLWGPSLSTPPALPVICSLWGGRDSDSATGTGTIILCSDPGLPEMAWKPIWLLHLFVYRNLNCEMFSSALIPPSSQVFRKANATLRSTSTSEQCSCLPGVI